MEIGLATGAISGNLYPRLSSPKMATKTPGSLFIINTEILNKKSSVCILADLGMHRDFTGLFFQPPNISWREFWYGLTKTLTCMSRE